MTLLIALLLQGVQENPAMERESWEFGLRTTCWLGSDRSSRMRSKELEGLGKGGDGKGTLLSYDDLGVDGFTPMSGLELTATSDRKHRFNILWEASRSEGTVTLSDTIEYDGDLHYAGERVHSEFSMDMLEFGYAYQIKDDLFGLPLDTWIGGRFTGFIWEGVIETEELGPIQTSDTTSNEIIRGFFFPSLYFELEYHPIEDASLRLSITWNGGLTFRRGVDASENRHGFIRAMLEGVYRIGKMEFSLGAGCLSINTISLEHDDETDVLNYRMLGLQFGVGINF